MLIGEVEDHGLHALVDLRSHAIPSFTKIEWITFSTERSVTKSAWADRGVVLALGHLAEDVSLAGCQLVERRRLRRPRSAIKASTTFESTTEPPSATARIAPTSCSTSSTRSFSR